MGKLKLFIGNYDGRREGAVLASSQVEGAKVANCSMNTFRKYWTSGHALCLDLKPNTLYTKPYWGANYLNDQQWHEGLCPLVRVTRKT